MVSVMCCNYASTPKINTHSLKDSTRMLPRRQQRSNNILKVHLADKQWVCCYSVLPGRDCAQAKQTYQEDDVGLGVAVPVHRVLVADAAEIFLPFRGGFVQVAGIVRGNAARCHCVRVCI